VLCAWAVARPVQLDGQSTVIALHARLKSARSQHLQTTISAVVGREYVI